jgi:hypothetical protein
MENWNSGTLEYWAEKGMIFPLFHHSNIPPFQYSIIPMGFE